jgi:hypothetical protein
VDKAKAFTTMWVVKLIQNKTNPILESTVQAAVNWYSKARGTEVPLWESRLNHSHDIMATTGIRSLALMQGAWANVVHHNPEIQQGDWVTYYNGESKKGDTLWPGRAKVINPSHSHKDKVVANWYGLNGNTEALTLEPPQDGEEAWHLDRKFCYKVLQGYNSRTKNVVDSNPTHDTYLVIGTNKEGDKSK